MREPRRPVLPESIEEGPQRGGVAAFGCPGEPASFVIGDRQQVPVALAVGDLVDAYLPQSVEAVSLWGA
jgi:hypothetical protein